MLFLSNRLSVQKLTKPLATTTTTTTPSKTTKQLYSRPEDICTPSKTVLGHTKNNNNNNNNSNNNKQYQQNAFQQQQQQPIGNKKSEVGICLLRENL